MKRIALHTGFRSISVHNPALAYISLATWLYDGVALPLEPLSNGSQKKLARNKAIQQRYQAGETLAELAAAYGISEQRVHQIIHRRRN